MRNSNPTHNSTKPPTTKKELKDLAKKIIGSVNLRKHPNWQDTKSLQNWLRSLREEL